MRGALRRATASAARQFAHRSVGTPCSLCFCCRLVAYTVELTWGLSAILRLLEPLFRGLASRHGEHEELPAPCDARVAAVLSGCCQFSVLFNKFVGHGNLSLSPVVVLTSPLGAGMR